MRTQLLHVVPVVDSEAECDYDRAANDESPDSPTIATRPVLSLAAAPETPAPQVGEARKPCETNDDYWLGGYVGI
jgi:hypothetical protein